MKRSNEQKEEFSFFKRMKYALNERLKTIRSSSSAPFDLLPDEILLHIFKFLPEYQLKIVSLVNRRFNNLTRDEELYTDDTDDTDDTDTLLADLDKMFAVTYPERSVMLSLVNKILRYTATASINTMKVTSCLHVDHPIVKKELTVGFGLLKMYPYENKEGEEVEVRLLRPLDKEEITALPSRTTRSGKAF